MLELTVEAKVNNRKFVFTFDQLKKLLSVVNDMIYVKSGVGRKKGNSTTIEFEKGYAKGYEMAEFEKSYAKGIPQAEKDCLIAEMRHADSMEVVWDAKREAAKN